MAYKRQRFVGFVVLTLLALTGGSVAGTAAMAQEHQGPATTDYLIGPQDVLTVTCYDQVELSGKFTVEADGTFTYPYIGRVKAGGITLRALEQQLRKQLVDDGYFKNPQITVAVETYRSQKVFVVGEVRQAGPYVLSGDMSLVEVLARAGSTLPSASGEAIIVHASGASGPTLPTDRDAKEVLRLDLRELQNGGFSQNVMLRDGDTIFVPRAESIYVYGQVKNPGAYALQHKDSTVLQALSLAGGITDRGRTSGLRILRTVNGKEQSISVKLTDAVKPGDVIMVPERFF
jgi:polysaccharide export outer membrane protein